LGATPAAFADGVSVSRLPQSSTLEGNVTVSDQDSYCDPQTDYCGWYGEASVYAVSLSDAETGGTCPDVYDGTHGVWVGNVTDDPTVSDSESFTFYPPATSGPIEICLYTSDSSGEQLDTTSFFAVTKAGGTVTSRVDWVVGCRVHLTTYVNGGNVIDGNIIYAIKPQGRSKTWFPRASNSDSSWWFEWGKGSYTIRAKFLGDSFVNPSPWVPVGTAHIRHCR
jgi:hypothetical protein